MNHAEKNVNSASVADPNPVPSDQVPATKAPEPQQIKLAMPAPSTLKSSSELKAHESLESCDKGPNLD